MKYRKANEVLPDDLLKEVQKYVDGEALYFPKKKERKKWVNPPEQKIITSKEIGKLGKSSSVRQLWKVLRINMGFRLNLYGKLFINSF